MSNLEQNHSTPSWFHTVVSSSNGTPIELLIPRIESCLTLESQLPPRQLPWFPLSAIHFEKVLEMQRIGSKLAIFFSKILQVQNIESPKFASMLASQQENLKQSSALSIRLHTKLNHGREQRQLHFVLYF